MRGVAHETPLARHRRLDGRERAAGEEERTECSQRHPESAAAGEGQPHDPLLAFALRERHPDLLHEQAGAGAGPGSTTACADGRREQPVALARDLDRAQVGPYGPREPERGWFRQPGVALRATA